MIDSGHVISTVGALGEQDPGQRAIRRINAVAGSTLPVDITENTLVLESLTDVRNMVSECPRVVVQERLNNARYLNKFLETVNRNLSIGGELICYIESNEQRYQRKIATFPIFLEKLAALMDFLVHRVLPKLSVTQGVYFLITKGYDRPVSLSETLGRLISCGYKVKSFEVVGGLIRIVSSKTGNPAFNTRASYGFLIRLTRVGRYGKDLGVYKFRTMHPYSEYLQDYIFQMNSLKEGGKFKNDFRVTAWGYWLRKFWLDEQPMWINFLKGDMKLVGVRPLSRHYFELYPKEMQEYRTKFKPGLIPPFYADLPETFEEIVDSERRYLQQYEEKPIKTNLKYLFRIFKNIFVRRARSS